MRVKRPAACHRGRPVFGRGLCQPCYRYAARVGTLADHPPRVVKQDLFVSDYLTLRGEGFVRIEIAQRLGMTRAAIDAAYVRAVRAGLLEPDPPHMRIQACEKAREKGLRA